jgi:hypothetical protein
MPAGLRWRLRALEHQIAIWCSPPWACSARSRRGQRSTLLYLCLP